ncbi:MAG: hypothetical protein WD872_06835 [Pirellulaceae bacterium]
MPSAVLLRQEPFPDRSLVAALLAEQTGFPAPVAAKLASRGAHGIVWEYAPQSAAQGVAAGLTAVGFPALVADQDQVPQPTQPRRVHLLQLDCDQLGVQLKYNGPPEWIAWHDVLVISAGAIRKENRKAELVEVTLHHGATIVEERVQVEIARDLLLDVFAQVAHGAERLHLRLHSHEVNYALTLGGTIHESWREKFALLVAKLGLRAERALVSPQTEALLAAGMSPENCALSPYFASEEDLAAYNRWLLARRLLA